MTELAILLGRGSLGALFVIAGVMHIFGFDAVRRLLAGSGVPWPSSVLLIGTVFQIGAGALLMLGVLVRPAALGLAGFTIAATLMVLRFWTMPPGPGRHAAANALLANVGVVGGLLLAAASVG